MFHDAPAQPDPDADASPPSTPPRVVDSRDLLQGARELMILHGDDVYRLNLTRSGKLILRK